MKEICPVYIIDSDSRVRQSLVRLLRREGFASTPFSDGGDFLDALEFLPAGIALLELRLKDRCGLAVQQDLLSRRLDIPLIMMSACADIPTAVEAIKQGAVDFLEKPFDDEALLTMLGNVRPVLDRRAEIQQRRDRVAAHLDRLTKRERDVVRALGAHRSNRDAADVLQISVRTVEMHRASIMKKFGAKKFSEIIQSFPDVASS